MDGITCQFTGPNANSQAVITKEHIGDLFGITPRFTQILFNNNILLFSTEQMIISLIDFQETSNCFLLKGSLGSNKPVEFPFSQKNF